MDVETNFVQVYSDGFFACVKDLRYVYSIKMLGFFLGKTDGHGVFDIKRRTVEEFSRNVGFSGVDGRAMTSQQAYMYVNDLMDNRLVVKLGKGTYQLNPFVLWRGDARDRLDAVKSIRAGDDYSSYHKNHNPKQ